VVFFLHEFSLGYGQENGGIVTKVINNHWQAVDIIYLENIPWFLPVYLHSFTATANGQLLTPHLVKYVPGRERERPYQLEVALRLPPRTTTTLSISFDYIFLKWQEYPPDANHGFYVGAAVITASLPVARNYTGIPLDGSTLLSRYELIYFLKLSFLDGLKKCFISNSFTLCVNVQHFSLPNGPYLSHNNWHALRLDI
jgi:GPI-anchor transamidase subunit T